MTAIETIRARMSRRSYLPASVCPADRARLLDRMEKICRMGGVRIELVEQEQSVFSRFGKSYGLFSGVHTFFALIERKGDPDGREKLGFFGELLVLEATAMGLGTCWVGGTYDAAACSCAMEAGETLACVIALGPVKAKPGAKEAVVHRFMRRGTKKLEEFYRASVPVPAWFQAGVQAVRLAPSAFNEQPVALSFENNSVRASVPDMARYRDLDLGIAKVHFALVTGGRWDWGNGGMFYKEARGEYETALADAIQKLIDRQCGAN